MSWVLYIASSIVMSTVLFAESAFSEPIIHTPVRIESPTDAITLVVTAPAAVEVRLLTPSPTGVLALPLTKRDKNFFVTTQGENLLGKEYQFQVRNVDGRVQESKSYICADDSDLSKADELTIANEELNQIEREIAGQRRELAQLRAQNDLLGVSPRALRSAAQALVQEAH